MRLKNVLNSSAITMKKCCSRSLSIRILYLAKDENRRVTFHIISLLERYFLYISLQIVVNCFYGKTVNPSLYRSYSKRFSFTLK